MSRNTTVKYFIHLEERHVVLGRGLLHPEHGAPAQPLVRRAELGRALLEAHQLHLGVGVAAARARVVLPLLGADQISQGRAVVILLINIIVEV